MAGALRGQASSRFFKNLYTLSRLGSPLVPQRWASSTKIITDERLKLLQDNDNELWRRIEKAFNVSLTLFGREPSAETPFTRFRVRGSRNDIYHTRGFLNRLDDPTFDIRAGLEQNERAQNAVESDGPGHRLSQQQVNPAQSNHGSLSWVNFKVPSGPLQDLQERHPDILLRLQAFYKTTIDFNPPAPADGSATEHSDLVRLRVDGLDREAIVKTKHFLSSLDKSGFDPRDALNYALSHENPNRTVLSLHLARNKFAMLKDNNSELQSQIEKIYNVTIRDRSSGNGKTRPSIRVIGEFAQASEARAFIESIDIGFSASPGSKVPVPLTDIKNAYKATMRCAPSSVVVLTTQLASSDQPTNSDQTSTLRGMTVSSMTSVTLDPEPVISFSIRRPSRTLDFILQGQTFFVNFLKSVHDGARIAHAFAQPHDDPSEPFRAIREQRLAEIFSNGNQEPSLQSETIPAQFMCRTLPDKFVEIGDHTVIFAQVIGVYTPEEPNERNRAAQMTFLAYGQTKYRHLNRKPLDIATLEKTDQQAADGPISSQRDDDAWLDSSDDTLATQPHDFEAQPQEEDLESRNAQLSDTPTAEDLAERRRLEAFNEDYFRMAEGENELLEERAADQRALGEAQKPGDHKA